MFAMKDYVYVYCLDFTSKLYPNDIDQHCIISYITYIRMEYQVKCLE